jgi:hypothetical protein
MNAILRRVLAIAGGLLAGAAAAVGGFWLLTSPRMAEQAEFGPWRSTLAIGESKQNPYTRARVALYGIWGLPPREAIYFTASEDEDGEPLRPECVYVIEGSHLPARWWSLTLYRGGFYIPNPANRYSWSQSDIAKDAEGGWRVMLRERGEAPNVLTMGGGAGRPLALLRLYQPDPAVVADRGRTPLPSIRRLGCEREAS